MIDTSSGGRAVSVVTLGPAVEELVAPIADAFGCSTRRRAASSLRPAGGNEGCWLETDALLQNRQDDERPLEDVNDVPFGSRWSLWSSLHGATIAVHAPAIMQRELV